MIYLSDDYLTKYQDVLAYILERAASEKYSFSYIEKVVAYSEPFSELEKSNITYIAFSSSEFIYNKLFPEKNNNGFISNIYGPYGWAGYNYIKLFLDLQITFETLFIIFPLQKMLDAYHLYHEMDYSQLLQLVKSEIKFSYLNMIMTAKKYSSSLLAEKTGIPFSTINALRYGDRDIDKYESIKLLKISNVLGVKMSSLLTSIQLVCNNT